MKSNTLAAICFALAAILLMTISEGWGWLLLIGALIIV